MPYPPRVTTRSDGTGWLGGWVVRREPVGVVAAITAYNFPFLLNIMKIGPALAVGITFIGLDQLVGFDPNSDANSPMAIQGLKAFFILLPAVLFALATLCLIGYPLTRRRHDEIRKALEPLTPPI